MLSVPPIGSAYAYILRVRPSSQHVRLYKISGSPGQWVGIDGHGALADGLRFSIETQWVGMLSLCRPPYSRLTVWPVQVAHRPIKGLHICQLDSIFIQVTLFGAWDRVAADTGCLLHPQLPITLTD